MKIGVIGGGQLGRMLALAGTPLGMNFAFLDPAPDACAASLGEHLRADYSDPDHLRQLADEVDLVTFEFESVPAETVAFLSQFVPVYPSAEALRIARDRWFEKSMFKDLGIPTPAFADIQSQADLDAAVATIGLPACSRPAPWVMTARARKCCALRPMSKVPLPSWVASPACWKVLYPSLVKCR